VAGKAPGRTDDRQIIFFNHTEGTGIQFASAGAVILRNLAATGFAGVRSIPLDWFLQDIPD
jgi:alanine dehydrogenase